MDLTKDRRDFSDLWESPLPTPLELVIFVDDVPGVAAAPAMEGLQEGRRHPPHGAASSLVGSGGPGTLSE